LDLAAGAKIEGKLLALEPDALRLRLAFSSGQEARQPVIVRSETPSASSGQVRKRVSSVSLVEAIVRQFDFEVESGRLAIDVDSRSFARGLAKE
jgi:hypothetical protein